MIPALTSLLEAEVRYAYFNAQRTAVEASGDAISTSRVNGVSQLHDANRPQSEYYNRAVVHPDVASVADVLRHIASTVQAIELLFPQQTEHSFACLLSAGFIPATSLCYLVGHPHDKRSAAYNVVEFRPDQREVFFDLLELSGASFPEEKRCATRHFYCTEEFRCVDQLWYEGSGVGPDFPPDESSGN